MTQVTPPDESITALAGRMCGKIIGAAAAGLTIILVLDWLVPTDDTDPSTGARSGMSLYRDAGTGCEYLAPLFGGLTPRLDQTGKQVCTP